MQKRSLTQELDRLKAGEPTATEKLWTRLFEPLVALAENRLRQAEGLGRVASGEDIASEALQRFFEAVDKNGFPELHDRDNLWRILSTITARAVLNLKRHNTAQKRGSGRVRGESVFDSCDGGIEGSAACGPTEDWDLIFEEALSRLTAKQQEIALMKLSGYSNQEISVAVAKPLRTVERNLHEIRMKLTDQ